MSKIILLTGACFDNDIGVFARPHEAGTDPEAMTLLVTEMDNILASLS